MRKLFILFLVCLFYFLSAFDAVSAIEFTAELFEQGSNQKKLLFRMKREEQKLQEKTYSKAVFSELSGTEAVVEEVFLENGKLTKYLIHHKQIDEERALEIKGNKVYFSVTKNGKTKTDDEDFPNNLVIGPTIVDYLQAHWDKVLKGEDVSIRFAVLDRLETVGFNLFKIAEKKEGDKETIQVKMKPASFLIAALVRPLIFTFEKDTGRLLALHGRTLPKLKVSGEWQDLDVDVRYHYKQ